MKNVDGSFKVDCAEAVGRWERYIDELLNDENDNILETVNMVEEPITGVTRTEVGQTLSVVKIGKTAGLSEVVSHMVKLAGQSGLEQLSVVFQEIFENEVYPSE